VVRCPIIAPLVEDELPCVACGYLLRGLDEQGRCPECNHPVADSRAAQARMPTRRAMIWLAAAMGTLAVVVWTMPWAWRLAFLHLPRSIGSFSLNPDGTTNLLTGLILLLPAWCVHRADSGPARPRAWRRATILLPLILILLAVAMHVFLDGFVSRPTNILLLATYAAAPIIVALEVLLLMGAIAQRTQEIPRGPTTRWLRLAQWSYGGFLLILALSWAPLTIARILLEFGIGNPPAAGSPACVDGGIAAALERR
jgi:hypothetical protein